MADPLVTVLLAVHNGQTHLRESLDSILSQTFDDFELIIVDDGSNDETQSILRSYGDARIDVLRNDENVGLSRSLNRGLERARGRYVARQDDDDVSEPDRLERQVAFLNGHPDTGLVASAYRLIDADGVVIAERRVPTEAQAIRWRLLYLNAFTSSSVVFRRELVDRVGGYSEEFPYAQDYDLWSRIAQSADLAALPRPLVRYRRYAESLTMTMGPSVEDVDRISRSNIRRLGGVAEKVAATIDREAAWRLLFAGSKGLGVRRAVGAARDVVAVHYAFAAREQLSRRRRARDRAALIVLLTRGVMRARSRSNPSS